MIRRKLSTALGLAPNERAVVVRALPLLLLARIALATLGYGRARDLLASPPKNVSRATPVAAIVRGVDIAARNQLVPATCLPRALVLHRLLRNQGWNSTLHVGVRRHEDRLDGHAWVTLDGLPLGEVAGLTETFVPIRGAV